MIDKVFIVIFLFSISNVIAQLEVNSIPQIEDAIENVITSDLFGCNVEISNIEYTGNIDALGSFTYTSNAMCETEFGLDRGILMTTGMIDYAMGPNNNGDDGEEWNIEYDDPFFHNYLVEHEVITPSVGLFDACVLEFDIVSELSLSVDFEVVFGSEEYTEWMSPFYADAFAFFVSEINGDIDPYFDSNPINIMETGNVLNINTTSQNMPNFCEIENKPISAWTIRPESDVFNMPGLNECLYIDNENGVFCDAIGYDGYTTPMLFNFSLASSASYHIKMIIIDGVSDYWAGLDSGVFIENINLDNDIMDIETPLFEYDILGDTIMFNQLNLSSPNINYAWDFDEDGVVDSEDINPIHVYAAPGLYTVNLEYTNACTGLTSFLSYDIIIDAISALPYISTPSITIFPNPTQDNLYISISNVNTESLIKIFDLSGRVIYHNKLDASFSTIDLDSMLPGMYHISIENKLNDVHYIDKLIIF